MRFIYHALNRRTILEIEENVVEKGRRKLLSRLVHARNDKEVMAAWRSDLNRVLHIFNVRSASFVRQSLTVLFQTEMAINTHMMVSDLHRNASTSQEGTDDQRPLVSVDFHPPPAKHSPVPRLKPGRPSQIPRGPRHFWILSLLESCPRRRQGPALDVTS